MGKALLVEPEITQVIVRFGIDAKTCEKLGGNPRQNNICGFVLVNPEDYKRIPKKVNYNAVIDEAIQLNQFLIEGRSAVNIIKKHKR